MITVFDMASWTQLDEPKTGQNSNTINPLHEQHPELALQLIEVTPEKHEITFPADMANMDIAAFINQAK